jgi:type II secretory pathway pseudopilin PulG
MKKRYLGFTLIEMLIVMGIMIILMAAGIAGGRFAIQRANRIQKQSAIRNLYQAAMGYYTDNRQFPLTGQTPQQLVNGDLDFYIDTGAFDGGVAGDFWYWVDGNRQEILFCANYTGDNTQGGGCEGNGFGSVPVAGLDNDMSSPEPWNSARNWLNGNAHRSGWDPDSPW